MNEEMRETVIGKITQMLHEVPFTFEFKVKKKPTGIKVIYECTQEALDAAMKEVAAEEGSR